MHIVFCIYMELHLQMQILPSAIGASHTAYDLKCILICQPAAFKLCTDLQCVFYLSQPFGTSPYRPRNGNPQQNN